MTDLRADVAASLAAVRGVVESESMFQDGPGYWVNGKEIAHFDGADEVDIRLTKAEIRQRRTALRDDDRVTLRQGGADWITVRFASTKDVEFVAELVQLAERAHRPPAGTTAKPPPAGSDLQRRRRLH